MRLCVVAFFLGSALSAAALPAAAQTVAPDGPPNVFLDCQTFGCDTTHFRNEIRFVNWVRDRADADVHLMITSQGTGGGGERYVLALTGLGRFAGDSARVPVITAQEITAAERRDIVTSRIAQSLMRYAVTTSAAAQLRVEQIEIGDGSAEVAPEVIVDPWNYWVFSTRLNASLNGESRESQSQFELSLSADRVTEQWKVNTSAQGSYRQQEYMLSERTVRSLRRDYSASTQVVRAIADLWSVGMRGDFGTSSFSNQDLNARLASVLEYSLYPYEDFSRRQLTVQYSVGGRHFDYEKETVLGFLEEQRMDQELRVMLRLQQLWGSARLELSGAHYLHDVRLYHLSTFGNFNVRLARGLSLDMRAQYSRVRDQIYLPKSEASDDDVLLGRTALGTGYRYQTSIGLRYTFGSIFNNVVNPRLSD